MADRTQIDPQLSPALSPASGWGIPVSVASVCSAIAADAEYAEFGVLNLHGVLVAEIEMF